MTDTQHYRSALCERRNNRTGATEWCVRLTHSSGIGDHSNVAWFDIPPGHSWFVNSDDRNWFCAFIQHRKNIAVKFERLHDAFGFLEILRPAAITDDADNRETLTP